EFELSYALMKYRCLDIGFPEVRATGFAKSSVELNPDNLFEPSFGGHNQSPSAPTAQINESVIVKSDSKIAQRLECIRECLLGYGLIANCISKVFAIGTKFPKGNRSGCVYAAS